jgi:hypothetical protein
MGHHPAEARSLLSINHLPGKTSGRRKTMTIELSSTLLRNAVAILFCLTSAAAFAADMDMNKPTAMSGGYQFVLVGPPKAEGNGKNIVTVKLVHGGKPVTGAIIIQSRADMGPIGMAGMTAPIQPAAATMPDAYSFEIANGGVWKKPDKWSLSFAAKVQGEPQTVHGSLVVELKP